MTQNNLQKNQVLEEKRLQLLAENKQAAIDVLLFLRIQLSSTMVQSVETAKKDTINGR